MKPFQKIVPDIFKPILVSQSTCGNGLHQKMKDKGRPEQGDEEAVTKKKLEDKRSTPKGRTNPAQTKILFSLCD